MAKPLNEPIKPSDQLLEKLASQGKCVVVCYNQAEVWQSRSMAAEFYREAMAASEGCERERYLEVYLDLCDGKAVCHDGVTEYLTLETAYR